MNRLTGNTTYAFRPPKYRPMLCPLFAGIGALALRRVFKVHQVTVEGVERVAELARAGESVLIAPNHGNHADPFVLFKIGRRFGLGLHFMATREIFEQSRLAAFALQCCGAFSVDRDGGDISAIKKAIQILRKGRHPLVIFPEGEVYHHHEKLDALNQGVATILLRALEKGDDNRGSWLVPASIQYRWADSVAARFAERLESLEQRIIWKPRPELALVERIYRLGNGLLALKETEFLGEARTGDIPKRLADLRETIVGHVERKHLGQVSTGGIPERVKVLRLKIRRRLTATDSPPGPEEKAAMLDDLDSLFVAVQLYSYPGQYLRESATIHRIAETIQKIEEDVFGKSDPLGPQSVHVRFGEPLHVQPFLREHKVTARNGVEPLTAYLHDSIQELLDGAKSRSPSG